MLLPIKLICDRRKRKDGTSPICIQYCFSADRRVVIKTGINIPASNWNVKSRRIGKDLSIKYGNYNLLNEQLSLELRKAEDIITFALKNKFEDPLSFLKTAYDPTVDIKSLHNSLLSKERPTLTKGKQSDMDLYNQIDDYIKSKEKKVCKDMPRIYRNMKEHLKAFEEFRNKPITFDTLDLNFYEEFVDFLMFEYLQRRRKDAVVGLKVNTIGKTIKQFRTFLRNRMRKKIIAPVDMDGWKILEEDVDAVYLTMDEIHAIYNLDLVNYPHLKPYRNDFVLGCLTGLRFSDFSEIMKDDVRMDMLFKKQNKSEHWVVIPLRDEALTVLKNRFIENTGTLTNGDFNKQIKTIGKLAGLNSLIKFSHKKQGKDVIETRPKFEWVTSHTCRRSFCTNEFLAGTPVELIMKISGHKSVKDFYKYIRITPEEAGQKIKELWQNRGGMHAFNKENKIASL